MLFSHRSFAIGIVICICSLCVMLFSTSAFAQEKIGNDEENFYRHVLSLSSASYWYSEDWPLANTSAQAYLLDYTFYPNGARYDNAKRTDISRAVASNSVISFSGGANFDFDFSSYRDMIYFTGYNTNNDRYNMAADNITGYHVNLEGLGFVTDEFGVGGVFGFRKQDGDVKSGNSVYKAAATEVMLGALFAFRPSGSMMLREAIGIDNASLEWKQMVGGRLTSLSIESNGYFFRHEFFFDVNEMFGYSHEIVARQLWEDERYSDNREIYSLRFANTFDIALTPALAIVPAIAYEHYFFEGSDFSLSAYELTCGGRYDVLDPWSIHAEIGTKAYAFSEGNDPGNDLFVRLGVGLRIR